MQKTVLSIAGKPGLYTLVSRGRNMLIVETVDSPKKRIPANQHDRVTSLNDVSMYTTEEDVPLTQVFLNIKTMQEGKPVDLEPKKLSSKQLAEFMAKALPNYDRDRVYDNDIRKVIQWYNILVNNGINDFEPTEEEAKAEEDAAEK